MRLPDNVYNILKWVGLIFFPACAWFVGRVFPSWGFTDTDAIVTTLNALGTFIGILIGVSTLEYNKEKGGGE